MADEDRDRNPGRRRFSEEFKRDAVELVLSTGRSIKEVAAELGVGESSLGNWVRQARVDRGEREGATSDDKARISELESELRRVKSERELLKRTVAFWVRESHE